MSQQEVSADIIQNSAVGNFSPEKEGTKTKAARCLFFLMPFPFLYILILCILLLLFTFCQVYLLVKETAEIEIGMAEKSSYRTRQANIRQKLSLVWKNRKKISQIIIDNFYLPFFLLFILCFKVSARYSDLCSLNFSLESLICSLYNSLQPFLTCSLSSLTCSLYIISFSMYSFSCSMSLPSISSQNATFPG